MKAGSLPSARFLAEGAAQEKNTEILIEHTPFLTAVLLATHREWLQRKESGRQAEKGSP